jgi:starch-binding outer membrane protein, SusD/RagB family
MKHNIFYFIIFITIGFSSCKLDYPNPNNANEEEILNTREGLITASIGIKQLYATDVLGQLYTVTGCTGREIKGTSNFIPVQELESGGNVLSNNNLNIITLWSNCYRLIATADNIITNAPVVLANDERTKIGVVASAKLFKAMSYWALLSGFENLPLKPNKNSATVTFNTRTEVIDEGLALLNDAFNSINTSASGVDPSAEFTSRVLGNSFNLKNVIQIYRARYYLLSGNYNQSFLAANSVPLSSENFFTYDGSFTINPLFTQFITIGNFTPRNAFGLPQSLIEIDDQRLSFYLSDSTRINGFNQFEILRSTKGFATTGNAIIPVYLPDEVRLIRAECIVRGGFQSLTNAVAEINAVRRQTSGDVFGVYAGLPAYAGTVNTASLLEEIYKQRCVELFLSGNRLMDNRRFGRTGPASGTIGAIPLSIERSRNYYPYPSQERQNNPNTPVDPGI